jgi:hypothetical protein
VDNKHVQMQHDKAAVDRNQMVMAMVVAAATIMEVVAALEAPLAGRRETRSLGKYVKKQGTSL